MKRGGGGRATAQSALDLPTRTPLFSGRAARKELRREERSHVAAIRAKAERMRDSRNQMLRQLRVYEAALREQEMHVRQLEGEIREQKRVAERARRREEFARERMEWEREPRDKALKQLRAMEAAVLEHARREASAVEELRHAQNARDEALRRVAIREREVRERDQLVQELREEAVRRSKTAAEQAWREREAAEALRRDYERREQERREDLPVHVGAHEVATERREPEPVIPSWPAPITEADAAASRTTPVSSATVGLPDRPSGPAGLSEMTPSTLSSSGTGDRAVTDAETTRRRPRSVILIGATVALVAAAAAVGMILTRDRPQEKVDPVRAALTRGLRAQNKGEYPSAISAYRAVLQIDQRNKFAYYNLGLIYQKMGQAALAEQNYRQALNTDPNFRNALFNLAVLLTGPKPQEAVTLYQRLIAAEPNFAAAHANIGVILLSLGHEEEGRHEVALALKLDPSLARRLPRSLRPQP